MKLGVNLKIDVTKLDKARFYTGAKGTYADMVVFIDTENKSQYGDHGVITQSKNKDEDVKLPIIGNAKIFWRDDNTAKQQPKKEPGELKTGDDYNPESDIPF